MAWNNTGSCYYLNAPSLLNVFVFLSFRAVNGPNLLFNASGNIKNGNLCFGHNIIFSSVITDFILLNDSGCISVHLKVKFLVRLLNSSKMWPIYLKNILQKFTPIKKFLSCLLFFGTFIFSTHWLLLAISVRPSFFTACPRHYTVSLAHLMFAIIIYNTECCIIIKCSFKCWTCFSCAILPITPASPRNTFASFMFSNNYTIYSW